ncbi:MAG: TlpA disulfide reductase family protein [Sumerlaeia bacterium]
MGWLQRVTRSKKEAALVAAVFVLAGAWLLFLSSGGGAHQGPIAEPQRVDLDFDIATLDGEVRSVAELAAGKPVILHYWGTWCPPCRAEMPEIQAFANEGAFDGELLLVAVNDSPGAVRRFAEDKGYDLPFSVLASLPGDEALTTRYFPTTLVISPESEVVYRREGAMSWDDGEFRAALAKLPEAAQ